MPEIQPILLAAGGAALFLGALIGWAVRNRRVKPEKEAIHASWQEQISAQRNEHDRIAQQNKNLMEQVSQFRASQRDADGRTKELSATLKNAVRECEALRTRLDESNTRLTAVAGERDRLKNQAAERAESETQIEALQEKEQKILKLRAELENWKNRLPPLMEKFRERNLEAEQLEVELEAARAKSAELERRLRASQVSEDRSMDETQVGPLENSALAAGLNASNEQYTESPVATMGAAPDSLDLNSLDRNSLDRNSSDPDSSDNSGDVDAFTESQVEPDESATVADDSANDPPVDDLKRIKGVGPAIERTLVALGITRIEQIAEMSEVDIDRIASELPGFRSRIHREDWMGQARTLLQENPST